MWHGAVIQCVFLAEPTSPAPHNAKRHRRRIMPDLLGWLGFALAYNNISTTSGFPAFAAHIAVMRIGRFG